jgi:formate-dependent nitrite reductase cytochrome c552 subunit
MYKARTNCLGCHLEQKFTEKGQRVLIASGKACVRCHTKDHNKMLKDWKTELAKEIKYTKEVEQQALKALAKHKPKLTKEKLAEFREMLKQGRADLSIVQFGNGVHNKKYSMMLLDAALTNFEDVIDELGEGG